MFVESLKKIKVQKSHRPVNFICKKSSSIFIHFYCLRKRFYLSSIVKLLDSYKVYRIIKVDPCWEVLWNWVFLCFLGFFSTGTTIHKTFFFFATPLPQTQPHQPHNFCVNSSILHTSLQLYLSPFVSELLVLIVKFLLFFLLVFCLSVFCLFVAPPTITLSKI